jgi:transcriptional regulator with XRE-family HTH domain
MRKAARVANTYPSLVWLMRPLVRMSQEAVALEAGLNRGYYSGVERGVRNVARAEAIRSR